MDSEHEKTDPSVFPHARKDLTICLRPTANAWWGDYSRVQLLLDAFDNHCASIDEACYIAGITRKQYKYFAQIHPVIYDRRKRAKFAKREREIFEKKVEYGRRLHKGGPNAAFRYLIHTEPETFDLRYRSPLGYLRRLAGIPAHPLPPKTEAERMDDMKWAIEKTRAMLGHPSDPRHYAQCQECEHLLHPLAA